MRYRLHTLLILLAVLPPLLAANWWAWERCAEYQRRQRILKAIADDFDGGVQNFPARASAAAGTRSGPIIMIPADPVEK